MREKREFVREGEARERMGVKNERK